LRWPMVRIGLCSCSLCAYHAYIPGSL
jgi:hypothetical protein